MNFDATEDQVSIRNAIQEICNDFGDDYWLQKDREGGFPEDFYSAIAKAGWLGIAMPVEYGGAGLGISEACAMMETVSASGAGMSGASSIHMNVFGLHPVVMHGSDEQKKRWLPPIISGEAKACFGVTEPNTGLNTLKLKTMAVRQGDRYVVNGQKIWISTAQVAHKILLLARTTPLDPPTAALGMIAGGASGIVGMSGELGADDRLVAFMQYLRVLVVVVTTPVVIAIFFGGDHGGAHAAVPSAPTFGDPGDWALAIALAAAGAIAATRARITAGVLLGPMVLTGIVVLGGIAEDFAVPGLLSQTAFAIIGLQVGLRFTKDTVRLLGRLTGPVLAMLAALLAVCFGLAVLLDATTSASLLDAYLATTPGGLYAVLAVAFGAGANTTFIVAVQSLRVIAMVLLAPLAVRWTLGLTR